MLDFLWLPMDVAGPTLYAAFIGSLTGLLGVIISDVLYFIGKCQKHKQELELQKMELELRKMALEIAKQGGDSASRISAMGAEKSEQGGSYRHRAKRCNQGNSGVPLLVGVMCGLAFPLLTLGLIPLIVFLYFQSEPATRIDIALPVLYLAGVTVSWWFRPGSASSRLPDSDGD